ncbi:MAG: hypothetical protein ACRD1H_06130, partial [Vicinamibacterales bacterium]
GREIVFALTCALAGAVLAFTARLMLGDWPSPVTSFSLAIVGIGAALVTVRYGRLGPFEGEFGPPKLETMLLERIQRETERAARYEREFSILAVRQSRGVDHWRSSVRGVDDMIPCRRGITIMLLPETSRDGALALLQRVTTQAGVPIQAALVNCPADGRNVDALAETLLRLVRQSALPGQVIFCSQDAVDASPIGV